MVKPLRELLSSVKYRPLKGDLKSPVNGLAYDSRQVTTGGLFACLPGLKSDGHLYIENALRNGALAIMIQQSKESLLPGHAQIAFSVPDARIALAAISAEFYEHPSARLNLIGVTGTNGKSTTVHLIDAIHRAAGIASGVVGTLGYRLGDELRQAKHTTPEAPDLQGLLAEMLSLNLTHVAMEVSSHALAQRRADGCRFSSAVFTNLSRDHLDYHTNEETYFKAKCRLFIEAAFMPKGTRANIINVDDHAGSRLTSIAQGEIITFAIDSPAQVRAAQIDYSPTSTDFLLESPWGSRRLSLPLLGRFNVYNALGALAVTLNEDIPLDTAAAALEVAQTPAGRFQRVPSNDYTIIIDYAHTPDGLEKVLATARDMCRGRLITVFGCGGDRDSGKRPVMGEIASRLADLCFVTSDNPRSEDPQKIIQAILKGIPRAARKNVTTEPDRAAAIRAAVLEAETDDLVLIAGKGHETYQIFADRTVHFDDRQIAREALQEKAPPRRPKRTSRKARSR